MIIVANSRDIQSYLYLAEANGYYKLGSSENPERRVRELQTGCPHKIKLVAKTAIIHNDLKRIEKFYHDNSILFHHRGEWFDFPEYVVDMIRNRWVQVDDKKINTENGNLFFWQDTIHEDNV